MSDPLSLPCAVAGLVTLVNMVFITTFRYVREVKSAEKSVNDLVRLLQTMCGTLHILRQRLHVLDEKQVHENLGLLPPIIEDCSQLLADVDRKLTKYQKHNTSTSAGRLASTLRKLQWPFDVSSTNQLVDQLTKFNDVLNTALNVNTMVAVHETLQAAGQLREDINKLERSLSTKINRFLATELDKEQREAVKHFQVSDPTERHKIATKLWQRGTGKWFTDSDDFLSWLEGRTPKLWLSGIPGAGKTILASAIIEKARRECYSSSADHALAYFYCDYKDPKTHGIANVLGSLAAQIAVHNEEAMKCLLQYYQKFCQPGRPPLSEEPPELADLIREMTKHFDRVVVVVDGLDECGNNVPEVTRELNNLVLQHPTNISMLLLSRHEHEIQQILASDYIHIPISAKSPDLQLYVYAQMERRTAEGRLIIDDADVKYKIIEKLVNSADGMFRWVACQMDYLCDLATDSEREAALNDLPPDLYSSYERILDRVNQKGPSIQRLVQRILKWVILSREPLSVRALREAVAVEQGDTILEKGRLPGESAILRHCSSLVRKSADGLYIEPAHFTVKEYLERIPLGSEEFSGYRIGRTDTNLYLAMVCVTYLSLDDFGHFETILHVQHRLDNHPFRRHAVESWMYYARGHFGNVDLMQLIRKLMKPEKSNKFLTWLHDYIWTQPCLGRLRFVLEDKWMQFTENVTPLHCAAFLRIPNLIEWLVSEGVATNDMSVVGSPLHCAILGTDVFISAVDEATDYDFMECLGAPADTAYAAIKALIHCQADVNQVYWRRRDKTYVSALYLLLRGWASDIEALCQCIKLLLNAGATIDARAGAVAKFNERDVSVVECFSADHVEKTYRAEFLDILGSCKELACAEGQMAEFSVVDDTSRQQNVDLLQSTLRFAARFQQLASLEKLLAIDKVDVDAADGVEGLNALHIAAKYGNVDAASILLAHGADVNAISSFGNTPLHECAWRRDTTMVTLLLSKGAKTDIQNKIHNTAWSTAAIHDNVAMLEMFEATYEGQEDKICELLALKHGPLFRAAESGRAEEATVFLASNTRRANLVDEGGCNLSHRVGYMSFGLLKALTQQGLDVKAIDKLGRTALHVIAMSERPQMITSEEDIRLLLAQGCDPGHISHPHGTALHALLTNKSFMNEIDVVKKIDYIQLFFSESVKTAVDGGGMTVLDACTTKAWHTPGFIDVFNCLLLYGMQSGTDRDLFADLVNQLLGVADPAWTPEQLFLPWASNILRKLLTIHPDPSVIVHGSKGRRAAVWAARHSLSDLLLDLVNKGVNLTYKVEELESECVLQAMMRGHHEDPVLRSVLDLSSDHDLETKSKISGSLLHLLCAKDSSARAVVVPMLLDRGLDVDAVCDNGRTPLMMAASSGRLEHLRCLVARGASVQRRDLYGWNVFHYACDGGNPDIVEYLVINAGSRLQWDVRVNVEWKLSGTTPWTLHDCTVLHMGTMETSTLALLLDNHPCLNIDVTTMTLETPVHTAALTGSCETLNLLIDRGATVDSRNRDGQTALHLAVVHYRLDIVQTLSKRGANINAKTKMGLTALHYAALNGFDQLTRFLLSTGATSTRDVQGLTPELAARSKGYLGIANLLKQHFDEETGQETTKLPHEARPDTRRNIFTALLKAIEVGDSIVVHELAAVDTEKENPACSGCSPVQVAAECGQWDIVKVLLEADYPTRSVGCSHGNTLGLSPIHLALAVDAPKQILELLLSRRDRNDMYASYPVHPLHVAATNHHTAAMEVLLRHCTSGKLNPSFDLDRLIIRKEELPEHVQQDSHANLFVGTPLHRAAYMNNSELAKMLLDHGAGLQTCTPHGLLTPLHIAAATGSLNVLDFLLDRGADVEARCGQGLTPVFTAVGHRQSAAVERLLSQGACLRISDVQPLCHVALLHDTRYAALLLKETLSSIPFVKANLGTGPLFTSGFAHILYHSNDPLPADFSIPEDSLSVQVYHEGMHHLKRALKWLDKHDLLSAQIRFKRPSPLCIAAQKGDTVIIHTLLDAGANIDDTGCEEGPPLMLACAIDRLDIVKVLIRRGASLTTTSDGKLSHALAHAARYKRIQRWLLVGRWTEQRRISASPHDSNDREQSIKSWSGLREVSEPLGLEYKQRRDETLLMWHIRKRQMLKWFEGRVLHYGPGVKYVFANFD